MKPKSIDYDSLSITGNEALDLVASHIGADRWYEAKHVGWGSQMPLYVEGESTPTLRHSVEHDVLIVHVWSDTRNYTKPNRAKPDRKFSVSWTGQVKERGVKRPKKGRKKMNHHRERLIMAHWWWNALNELSLKMGFWKDISNRGWLRTSRWLLHEAIIERLCQFKTPNFLMLLPCKQGWEVRAVPMKGRVPQLDEQFALSEGATRRHAWRNALLALTDGKKTAPWPQQEPDWPKKAM
jgi:hypothetical protein|tara:strand:+ start:4733 stop:5446 length:714 start_codon:yes stop_codon:yes gene_type:complete